jgi:dTDP-4-dehydrorhamnose 3,5-epimerase
MILKETELGGCYLVDLDRHEDERGFFARTYDAAEFAARGLTSEVSQCSVSYNVDVGTLRGLHYQVEPWAEAKLVRCTRGRIFDVAVDLRPDSPTFAEWTGVELSDESGTGVFIPEGVAHGFLTLEKGSEVAYQISAPFHPEAFRGIRWDDPHLSIDWPAEPRRISERDANLPFLSRPQT